jgi:hypothetical protein
VAASFRFEHRVEFLPEDAETILRGVPAAPGVFALRGERESDEPYLTRGADLRRRMRRLLASPDAVDEQGRPVLSKRLNLRDRVRWIEWTRTGSEFESTLVLYKATRAAYGAEQARKRLRLHPPYVVRITATHEHPRAYVTNRLSRKSLAESFGPFPSRAAAERYCDAMLDLFLLRRCHEDLEVHPEHPGCAYGEMKKCMAPCKAACTAEEYANESARVLAFLRTRGESMLAELAQKREAASEAMDFEGAASLHKRWEQVKAAVTISDEIVGPIANLRALVLQEAAPWQPAPDEPVQRDEAAIFLFQSGCIHGPERLSTLGVRAVREQTAVGSSLFAQPLMLTAVPEDTPSANPEATLPEVPQVPSAAMLSPEERARALLAKLEEDAHNTDEPDPQERGDFLALFRRWYYRPAKQRAGEPILPNPDGSWPVRRVLNAAARVVLGPPKEMEPVQREAAAAMKTKVIHPGREGIEKVVPVLPKRSRTRKAIVPNDVMEPSS